MNDDYQRKFSDSEELGYICECGFVLTRKDLINTDRPHVHIHMFEVRIHPDDPRSEKFGPNWSIGLKYRESMLHYVNEQEVSFSGLSWQSAVEKTKQIKAEVKTGMFDDEISQLQSK